MESWFLFGFLAKLQQTIFVERENRTTLIASKTIIEQALQTSSVVLFAEGTTTDGTVVLPFNSSFVSNPAQAVCIHYKEAAKIAWFGDMTLTPHLWQVFKLSKIEVSADFLECYLEGNRKFIAESAQKIVSAKHQETIMKNV